MATFIDKNVKFHTFSKSPVMAGTTLGAAVNASGHTVTTSQVRADDIPWFINSFASDRASAITWIENNATAARHNDIVFYGGEFKAGFTKPSCLIYKTKDADGNAISEWQDFPLSEQTYLYNKDDKAVIAIHQNCEVAYVDGGNNAATNSNKNSIFVKRSGGTILDHFVASTDKIHAGIPSLGYNALVLVNDEAIDEGELDDNYIGNTFAGIIHFNTTQTAETPSHIKVTCYEYIGDKLDTTVAELAAAVFGSGGEGGEDATLVQKVAQNTAAIATLTGEGAGSVKKALADAKEYTDALAKGAVATNTAAIATLNGEGEGSVAKTVADAIAGINVGVTKVTLTETKDDYELLSQSSATGEADITLDTTKLKEAIDAKAAQTDLTALQGKIDTLTGDDGTIATIQSEIEALETTVGNTTSGLVQKVNTNAAAIEVLQSTISSKLVYKVVSSLEEAETEKSENTIYLVPDTEADAGDYIEYLCYNNGETPTLEKIGTTKTDLSGYVTTGKLTEELESYVTSTSLETTLGGYTTTGKLTEELGKYTTTSVLQSTYATKTEVNGAVGDITALTERVDTAEDNITSVQNNLTALEDLVGSLPEGTEQGKTIVTHFSESIAALEAADTALENAYKAADTKIRTDFEAADAAITKAYEDADAATLESAKGYTNDEIGKISLVKSVNGITATHADGGAAVTINAKNEANYFGSTLATVSTSGTTVSVVSAPAKEWAVDATDKPAPSITSVTNGKASNGAIIDTENLTDGASMFGGDAPNTALTTVCSDFGKMTSAVSMFRGCSKLETFCGDLSSLTNGTNMFNGCAKLSSFCGDLSSLTTGDGMFAGCTTLTTESIDLIIDVLPVYAQTDAENHPITIANASDTQIATALAKGWKVTA